jgi:hypothetical protein
MWPVQGASRSWTKYIVASVRCELFCWEGIRKIVSEDLIPMHVELQQCLMRRLHFSSFGSRMI